MHVNNSQHDATRPNLTHAQTVEIGEFIKDKLKGRDFVLIILEHPNSTIVSNQLTQAEAKSIVNQSLARPWKT